MPYFLRQLIGIITLVICATSCGCATLFNSVNFKNAPRKSFVKVEVATPEYISVGSGVIIRQIDNFNSVILTAGHICKDNIIAMRVLDFFENEYGVLTFITSPDDDLCVIVTDRTIEQEPIKVSSTAPEVGDHIYNIAAPMGIHAPEMSLMFHGYYEGMVNVSYEKYPIDIYGITGMSGSSGSPIFNDNWEIIGVISRGIPDFQHVMMSVNQQRTKLFYDYVYSEKFIDDVKISSQKYKKSVMELINKLLGK